MKKFSLLYFFILLYTVLSAQSLKEKLNISCNMSIRLLIIVVLAGFIASCKPGRQEASRLNVVLFGYDSIACFYGNSAKMIDLRYGKLTDPLFMDSFLTAAIDRKPDLIVLKPGDGASVLGNWEHLDTLFKNHNFEQRKIDTLDEREQQFFNTTSALTHLQKLQEEPLRLFLPKEENNQPRDSSGKGLVVLILNEQEVYAYNGKNVKSGRRSTYQELQSYLSIKKSDRDFLVIIKPGKNSSYKSVVDVLDLMTIEEVKNYKLEDMTAEEEAIITNTLNEKAAL